MRTNTRSAALAALFAIVVGAVALSEPPLSEAADGLINSGFESGTLDGAPVGWDIGPNPAQVAVVVDEEGPVEFPTYADMGDVTVSPYRGIRALRIGTPQRLDQNQAKGTTTVSQEYNSVDDRLQISFRAFSWEHRNQDTIRIDIKDGPTSVGDLASPVDIKRGNGTVMHTCIDIPCEFSLDAGSQGDYVASDWLVLDITNVPLNRTLKAIYELVTKKDASHTTWFEVDNVNTPPVAKFAFAPSDPEEGDAVQMIDLSYDPDPGDTIVSWLWQIGTEMFDVQNPYFIFPNEGDYFISLTVTDSAGASTTVIDGDPPADGGPPVPIAFVTNAEPLVNALNHEAVEGDEFTLTGRFLDAGYQDTITAQWLLPGNPTATVEQENDPLIASGLITGSYAASSGASGTLRVSDGVATSEDDFSITVIPNTLASQNRDEGINDTAAGAPVRFSDGQYVDWILEEGDIDVSEIRLAGSLASGFKPGSEILVNLTDLPADLDVAIVTVLPEGASTGVSRVGVSRVGVSRVAFSEFDSSMIGVSRVGVSRVGVSRVGVSRVGLTTFGTSGVSWADIGVSRVGVSRVGVSRVGTEVTPLDVSLEELGLGSIGGDETHVTDFSANRGLDDETAWAVASVPGAKYYVAVFGANGEHSLSHYTMSIEVIEPPDLEFDLGSVCDGAELVPTDKTFTRMILHDYDDPNVTGNEAAATVIATNEKRMRAEYNMDQAAWVAFLVDLVTLAQHPAVRADIVSMPSSIYDNWDLHPCLIEAANSVATQIKALLYADWPTVENVVITGNDNMFPFFREPDDTVIGNEQHYILDAQQKPGSPLFASILLGYVLTDDFYADSDPNAWVGGDLYIPERAIGRLVETPQEIQAQVVAAVNANLLLNPATGFVAGYDFFQDGAADIQATLDAGLSGTVTPLINDTWNADDLRCQLLAVGVDPICGTRDVSVPNAHFSHYAALSADGFLPPEDFSDFLGADEVAAAGGAVPLLAFDIVFTMGCHSGFSAPDGSALPPDEASDIDGAEDFPQAFATQRAVFVGSTGYAYGETDGTAGTEKLMGIFAQKLMAGGVTVGDALRGAKVDYLAGAYPMTVYDVKSSNIATLYGLPMYSVDPVEASQLLAVPVQETQTATPVGTFALTTIDSGSTSPSVLTTHTLASVDRGANRTFYRLQELSTDEFTLEEGSQVTAGRTIQPKGVFDVDLRHPHALPPAVPPPLVHGVLLRQATYSNVANIPVFGRPTNEWETLKGPYQKCHNGFSPSETSRLNSLDTGDAVLQALVVIPGQFRCTSGSDTAVAGDERLYSSMTLELRRCDSTDLTPPSINDVQLRIVDEATGTLKATIDVSDEASGVARVMVLSLGATAATPFELVMPNPLPPGGVFEMTLPGAMNNDLLVQAEDGACNTVLDTAKSAGRNVIKIDAGPDQARMPVNTLTTKVYGFTSLEEPVWFVWEFGDGTFLDGVLAPVAQRTVTVDVDVDGNATFSVTHPFGSGAQTPLIATVEVHNSVGGIGVDDVVILCDPLGDAANIDGDLIGCGSSNNSATITLNMTVAGAVSNDTHYRIALDYGKKKGGVFRQPPDGLEDNQIQWNNGNVTGVAGATAIIVGSELRITFPRSSIPKLAVGARLQWYVQTQDGVPGEPGSGQVDRMPNAGWLSHTIQ